MLLYLNNKLRFLLYQEQGYYQHFLATQEKTPQIQKFQRTESSVHKKG